MLTIAHLASTVCHCLGVLSTGGIGSFCLHSRVDAVMHGLHGVLCKLWLRLGTGSLPAYVYAIRTLYNVSGVATDFTVSVGFVDVSERQTGLDCHV